MIVDKVRLFTYCYDAILLKQLSLKVSLTYLSLFSGRTIPTNLILPSEGQILLVELGSKPKSSKLLHSEPHNTFGSPTGSSSARSLFHLPKKGVQKAVLLMFTR